MACTSCMKAKANSMRTVNAAAARSAATMPPGYSADHPIVLGEAIEGAAARRMRVAKQIGAMRLQNAYWVTGTGVDPLITDGSLVDIGDTPQRRRLWKVGGFTFTDEQDAAAAAEKLGLTAVEIA